MDTEASPVQERQPLRTGMHFETGVSTAASVEIDAQQPFAGTVGVTTVENPVFSCQDVDVWYGAKQAIRKVGVDIGRGQVLAMIGPSGCGKSTFLRCLNA